nr:hypothetical protein [uncultured Acetatifactor sp.]
MDLSERQKLFENPTAEYRGKPFWSWNGRLEEAELCRQIDIIKEMGFGGYFMHSRTGLETEYLGEEWFELTNKCADYGHKAGMESWLYDEDRWPSGSAGGMVTKEEQYRAMFLEMNCLTEDAWKAWRPDENAVAVFACKMEQEPSMKKGQPGGCSGIFSGKRLLRAGDALAEGVTAIEFRTRYSVCNDNYNGYCYVNTMHREAIEKYIELTHEKYREKCGDRFGKEISGIFTDEPHRGGVFTNFAEGEPNAVPYTPDLFPEFEKRFGYSLKENLPELFLRRSRGELSKVTRDYFELCQELFLERFAIPVQNWCRENGLIFTGHVLHEDSLCCQAIMQGSLMRFYEYMDYPGIDILSEGNRCYWVAKQISSVARQLDKEWILSELYGCTGWQMDFESYKNVGDWQALFGVSLRCPHLSWYTMKGEAKRDYPASMLHQSCWYRDYHYVEDYFSRIHAALHDGKPVCDLLVLNPIESVWARAYSGSFDGLLGVDPEIIRLERQYAELFHILSGNQIDFDYGEEDIMSRHGKVEEGVLYVGSCAYRKVLVAGMDTMRSGTLALLEEFAAQGGEVIFVGEVPGFVDVIPSDKVRLLADRCRRVAFEEKAVARAAGSGMEVRITPGDSGERGKDATALADIFVQSFEVDGGRMVMLLNVNRERDYNDVAIDLGQGEHLELWDARSGRITRPPYRVSEGRIHLTMDLEKGGERIFLIARARRELPEMEAFIGSDPVELPDTFRYRLSEPNICVLDMVSVTDGRGDEIPRMEVLKADRALRDILGIPYRGGEMLQPWYQVKYKGGNTKLLDTISLRYDIEIAEVPGDMRLAVEDLTHIRQILVNGKEIPLTSRGKWIDICFDELEIPAQILKTGRNTVTIAMDYYSTCGIEAVYLLGDFGVEIQDAASGDRNSGGGASADGAWAGNAAGRPVEGVSADAVPSGSRVILTGLPERLAVGDITGQGLPFYSGSVIYELDGTAAGEEAKHCRVSVKASGFGGAFIKLHGKEEAAIAFPPYQAELEDLRGIEVVLTRRNTFGPLHQYPKEAPAYGPGNFMTTGQAWSDAYMLYPQGLLEKPEVRRG